MGKLIISVLLVAVVAISFALDCSHIITKEQEGVLNWRGRITFEVPVDADGWTMTMYFSQNFTGVGVWEGLVQYNGTIRWAEIRNRDEQDARLIAGQIKSQTFRVNYGLNLPAPPEVVNFRFQDIELCI